MAFETAFRASRLLAEPQHEGPAAGIHAALLRYDPEGLPEAEREAEVGERNE